ncbi:MAG: hypothetical protein Q4D40_04360 [Eubacteriales bacterium]|nr:hypothetical protein [Eubacteriales bacterium]
MDTQITNTYNMRHAYIKRVKSGFVTKLGNSPFVIGAFFGRLKVFDCKLPHGSNAVINGIAGIKYQLSSAGRKLRAVKQCP